MQVLVFKTSKSTSDYQLEIAQAMKAFETRIRWNTDLEDCDKILRVETQVVSPEEIILSMQAAGFFCEELD